MQSKLWLCYEITSESKKKIDWNSIKILETPSMKFAEQ